MNTRLMHMNAQEKIIWMYSFRVKQYQDADYVYYVICVYRCFLISLMFMAAMLN